MNSATAYNAAISSYQAAITSLQSNTNTLICFFAALLAFVGIVSAGFFWIIGVQSSKANEKMKKAEELSKEAASIISKAEEKQKDLNALQEQISENVTALTNLVDSQEVKDKLKEIDNIKRFVTQTSDRIYCEQMLGTAKRKLKYFESSSYWSMFIYSEGLNYNKYEELKGKIDYYFSDLSNWNMLDNEQFLALKIKCKAVMDDTASFCDEISEDFTRYINNPLNQLKNNFT